MIPGTTEVMRFGDFAAKGNWPMGPAVLDNTYHFFDACEFLWREQNQWKTKLRINGD